MKFSETLTKLREKAKLTRYGLAREADIDDAYVLRLESGERQHPSRDAVLKLGQALMNASPKVSLKDVDRLLNAAGHGPIRRDRVTIHRHKK